MAKKASKSPRKNSAQKPAPDGARTATRKDGRGTQGSMDQGDSKKTSGSRGARAKPDKTTASKRSTTARTARDTTAREARSAPATRKNAAPSTVPAAARRGATLPSVSAAAGDGSESRKTRNQNGASKPAGAGRARTTQASTRQPGVRRSAAPGSAAYRPGISRAAATARAAAEEIARAVSLAVDTAVSEAVNETVYSSAVSTARPTTTRTAATARAAAEELTRAVNQAVANLAASHAAARAQQMEREKQEELELELERTEAEYPAAEKPARRGVQRSRPAAPEPVAPAISQRPLVRVRKRVGPRPNVVWETYPEPVQKLVDVGRQMLGIDNLRPGQAEALAHITAGRDVLAVMPTGSGKSLLYQLPSTTFPGLTVVVSPLIALIKDQIDKMVERGVPVCRFDSTLTIRQERDTIDLMQAPGGKLVLTTPERMAMPEFRELLLTGAGGVGVSLFVVDEAHCVSQWGHDFRPAYLTLRKALEELGRPQVLATTATAPPHVREDILHQLGMENARVVTTTFERSNLHFEVIALPGEDDKMKTLVTLLKKLPKPGVVYCATVKKVDELWEKLFRHDIHVVRYHGRMTKKERDTQQQLFMDSKDLVMIATNAFGLGVDKSNIRYVLHYHVPGSLEAYAQEAGRAGRDSKPARCVLLFSPDDVAIQEYFLTGTYPTRRQVRAVYNALTAWSEHDAPPTVANLALSSHVGTQRTRTVLSLLKDEGFVVERDDTTFWLADPPPDEILLNEKARQYEARRIADRQRLDALLDYVRAPGCRNQVILGYLGEPDRPACGRCDNCLRSRDAALAAADRATRLEESLTDALNREWGEDTPKPRRVIRHRVIRIDEPAAEAEPIEIAAAAEAQERVERVERGQRGERSERSERGDRSERGERGQESGPRPAARIAAESGVMSADQPGGDVIRRRRAAPASQMALPLADVDAHASSAAQPASAEARTQAATGSATEPAGNERAETSSQTSPEVAPGAVERSAEAPAETSPETSIETSLESSGQAVMDASIEHRDHELAATSSQTSVHASPEASGEASATTAAAPVPNVVQSPVAAEYDEDDEDDDDEYEYEDDEDGEDEDGEDEDGEDEDDEYGDEDGDEIGEYDEEYYEDDEDEDEDEDDEDYEVEEYEEGEGEDDEYEYEYYEDDEEIEAIDKTAAALAEEGLDTSDNEITILARKRVPKPQAGAKPEVDDDDEAGKRKRKRRRRRRKKRGLLPPKSAFTSPVLSQPAPAPETHRHRGRRGSRSGGPVIEYVRGPMRINMTPVASATPNDVAPSRNKKKKRRFGRGEDEVFVGSAPSYEASERGRRRRKRRKRRRRGGPGGGGMHDEPVAFFSVQWPAGEGPPQPPPADSEPAGGKKRRRRRRRRGRGGRGNQGGARVQGAQDSSGGGPDSDGSAE